MADFPSREILGNSITKVCGLDKTLKRQWASAQGETQKQMSYPVTYTIDEGFKEASSVPINQNPGIFIPYFADKFTYDFAMQSKGKYKWMASGPFSGCKICIFSDKNGVGMGHISQPGVECAKDWKKFKERDDVKVHYEEKIPIPYETRHSASYLFLDLRNESDLVLTQINLTITNGMGGDKGIVELVRSGMIG